MSKPILAILALILASLSCGTYITPTPTPNALVLPTPTRPTATPPPTATVTTTADAQTATIRQATVNLRDAPDGKVIGSLSAGDSVTVNKCTNNWCEVSTKVKSGFVWIGCLDETVNVDKLGCEAE